MGSNRGGRETCWGSRKTHRGDGNATLSASLACFGVIVHRAQKSERGRYLGHPLLVLDAAFLAVIHKSYKKGEILWGLFTALILSEDSRRSWKMFLQRLESK